MTLSPPPAPPSPAPSRPARLRLALSRTARLRPAPLGVLLLGVVLLGGLLAPAAEAARRKAPVAPPPEVAPAAPAPSPAELALVEAVGRSPVPAAEYLFLLDTSGGMAERGREALAGIAGIVEQLRDGDQVSIIPFHTRATEALPRTVIGEGNRAAVVAQIRALPLTSAKDSDLGAGLASAAATLNQTDGAPLQFLFVYSTFCHDPSVSSDFDSGGRGCRAIRGLAKIGESFGAGRKDRVLVTTLFEAATADRPQDPQGISAAQGILGESLVVDTARSPFPRWAAEYRARFAVERVLPLVRKDAERAALRLRVVREPTAQRPSAQVEVSAGTSWVPVALTDVRISGEVAGSVPAAIDLAQTVTLEIPVKPPSTPFAILPNEDVVSLPITLAAEGSLMPAEGLAALGIDAARPGMVATTQAQWSRRYGLPGWLVGALFVGFGAVASGVGIFLQRRLRQVRLGGAFSYRRQGGPRQPLDLADLEQAWIAVDDQGALVTRRQGAVMVVRMVKQGLDARAEVEILVDGIEINRKPARRGRHRVVAGATSFQFGEYRLTWE